MKNVIVFTMHRSASMFLFTLTRDISHHFQMPYYSVNDQSFPDEHAYRENPVVFTDRQGCFCPVRFYVKIPNIEQFNIVLHLRDPRDVLTSWYYSKTYSHPRRKNEFMASDDDRARWVKEGVDVNVLRDAQGVLLRYEEYCEHLLGKPNVNFVKYEDMVFCFRRWLRRYISSFPIEHSTGFSMLGKKLLKEVFIYNLILNYKKKFRKPKENVYNHVRQILPGDHKRKLKPETIEKLNNIFGYVLKRLEYDL